MAEYIEREAVINHLRECEGTPSEIAYTYPVYKDLEQFVESLPAADVAPVVRGRWELHKDGSGTCKRCHTKQKAVWDIDRWQNYCGHCGARMEESESK